jgi:hypothetical protein
MWGVLTLVGGCTTARTNARLDPGLSGGVAGMATLFFAGHGARNDRERRTDETVVPLGEAFLQYAWTNPAGTGTAIQLKVPLLFFLSSVDVYHQFQRSGRWSQGAGLELGAAPAAYYLVTRHEGSTYTTFTARLLSPVERFNAFATAQLSYGRQGTRDLFLFAAYNRALGDELDLEFENHDYQDLRRAWFFVGVGARF